MDQKLLQRYITGDATDDEKAKVLDWLDADEANVKEFMSLRKLHDLYLWQESHGRSKKTSHSLRTIGLKVLGMVALLAVVFTAGFAFQQYFSQKPEVIMQTIHVPAGQRAVLTLTDGTKVWLNAKTTLTFPNYFEGGSRNVRLNGEGYFRVAKDTDHPFIVNTERYDIRALGTEFNVLAYTGTPFFATSLLEGSVEVYAPSSADKPVRLIPNTYIYLENDMLKRKKIEHRSYFLWREGLICFYDATVGDMIAKLQLYYDVKINVYNDKLLKSRYSGKFRTKDGVEHVLKVLQLRNKFTYEKNDELNVITIR